MLFIIFEDQTSRIKDKQGNIYSVYKSNTTINPYSIKPIKKTMYSIPLQEKCRINWDILHLSDQSTVNNLKLHFNFKLDECEVDAEVLRTLSYKLLANIGKQWDLSHVIELQIQKENGFMEIAVVKELLSLNHQLVKMTSKEDDIYKTKKLD